MQLTIPIQIAGSTLLALIPALIWGYIFWLKLPESRRLTLLTFFVGATAVFPILFYKYLWQYFPWLNAFQVVSNIEKDFLGWSRFGIIPISVILTFLLVGVIEEVMKNVAVRVVDDQTTTKNIDDAIELSIIAALGFAFTENIIYFHNIWVHQGPENLLLPFVFRSIFSTFAHVMFSAVFGYYYGISLFAKPILWENRHRIKWPKLFQDWFGIKKEEVFAGSEWLIGLIIASILHAIYNIFLEMNWTFLLVPYLTIGYIYVNYLMEKKETNKKYNLLWDKNEVPSFEAEAEAGESSKIQ